ncbi:MAG TPA: hypothetical protein VNI84_11140 [Pyrinomonadaceae bacterium]|nr:hypothetical protein [Pyrinomonadaceae bacterium]
MFVSLLLLIVLTIGGLGLTYLFAKDETLLWRACAGHVVGSVVFSLICFLAACLFGFSTATVSISYLLTLLPLALFARGDFRRRFFDDWEKAGKKLEGVDAGKFLRFAYYFFFLLLFWFFFQRAMMETPAGIFIGSSHNLGDLPFHLGAIFSFTDGLNFPPENPSFAYAKFTYPFMVDLIAATFVHFGARVSDAFLAQNVLLAFSLLVILERFTFKLTGNRLAQKLAPVLLFFCGGVGFLWFFKDAWYAPKGIYDYFWNIGVDYTIRQDPFRWKDSMYSFRWGNSLTTLFLTQRSLILGMPLTLIALQKIWEFFSDTETKRKGDEETRRRGDEEKDGQVKHSVSPSPRLLFSPSLLLVGFLAGTLPLVHTHSLAVLFLVCACLFFFSLDKWREWIAFGAGVSIVAIPELLWAMTGSATRFGVFVDWHFGWSAGKENYVTFYARNLGFFIPLLIAGIYFVLSGENSEKETELRKQNNAEKTEIAEQTTANKTKLLIFYIPFLLCFVIPNIVRLAPWEWDNIKVLIYWFVGSVPFVAYILARLWEEKGVFRIAAAIFLVGLTLAGALDIWRVASRALNYGVFEADSIKIAEQIKQKTAPNAMFLNAPTYNTAVVLSGRRSMMRYTGHLSSYGIDYEPRENELKRIYEGSATAESFLKKNNIEYVLISPEERGYAQSNNVSLNEDYFRRFPVVAEVGQYRVYKVK